MDKSDKSDACCAKEARVTSAERRSALPKITSYADSATSSCAAKRYTSDQQFSSDRNRELCERLSSVYSHIVLYDFRDFAVPRDGSPRSTAFVAEGLLKCHN